jgi:hypothetical protein
MLIKRADDLTGHSAVFEDDGGVAYAYLLDEDEIVADVWLYNRVATPGQPEWRDSSRAPFLNPRGFASSEQFPPVADESEVAFSWSRGTAGQTALRVFIRGDYHAMLVPGSKPGWCKLAARDGPLASVLREDDELER